MVMQTADIISGLGVSTIAFIHGFRAMPRGGLTLFSNRRSLSRYVEIPQKIRVEIFPDVETAVEVGRVARVHEKIAPVDASIATPRRL